ncbi:MAG: sensor histidine kinase [Sarcina sp.]
MIKNIKISSRVLLVISAWVLIVSVYTLKFTINPYLYLLLISAFIVNGLIVLINNYSIYKYGKYFSLTLIVIFGFFSPNFVLPYLYASCITAITLWKMKIEDKYLYIIISIFSYFLTVIVNAIFILSSNSQVFNNLYSSIFSFTITMLIVALFTIRAKGKTDINLLNKELEIQNKKLQEYATQVEELTILNERNRIAQELHDSLGHYLMAISMHVDILDKVKTSPDKTEEIIKKTKVLVKDSIKELRTTVFELKEMKKSAILATSLDELINNFSSLDNISFELKFDENVETTSPFIKDIIYKTVKEAITNGIKHGNASKFEINIKAEDGIKFFIKNNGTSPTKITKSNGLLGIEKRLALTRGFAEFDSKDGFTISCYIPNKI